LEIVVVERRFENPVRFEDIQGLEGAGAACLSTHGVRFLHTYLSRDCKRMLCVYEAPDAESVRMAESQAGVPFDAAWTCQRLRRDSPSIDAAAQEYVVVERAFPAAVTPDFASEAFQRSGWCFDMHRTAHLESYLANDGFRMICVFRAPDAESVRNANNQAGGQYVDLWTASVHS